MMQHKASLLVRIKHHSWYAICVEDKAYINRVRRAAARQGLTLHRSRTKDPRSLDFGWHIRRGKRELAHLRELDEVERWLAGDRPPSERGPR
jgi:hypothetical protein